MNKKKFLVYILLIVLLFALVHVYKYYKSIKVWLLYWFKWRNLSIQDFSLELVTNTWNSNLLTWENKKLWLKYKPELIKKWKDCYLYRIKVKNVIDKKLYDFAYDFKRKKLWWYPLYIKWYYNSKQKCRKEDYEDCNIYLMEKWIKVYDDDYECDDKQVNSE